METLTDLVQAEFKLLVTEGTWLTDRTKKLAEEKIEAIVRNIGYPDFILDDVMLQTEVEGLNYKEDEFFENVLKNLRWRTTQEMGCSRLRHLTTLQQLGQSRRAPSLRCTPTPMGTRTTTPTTPMGI